MTHSGRFAIAAVLCALAVYWYVRRTAQPAPPGAAARVAEGSTPPAAAAAAPPGTAGAPPGTAPPGTAGAPLTAAGDPPRFRRIDPAARRALLDRIAARAAGTAPPSAPIPAPAPLSGSLSPSNVVDAIMPLVPAIQDCYDETRANRTADRVRVTFDLMLVGDAEVGTLIDSIKLDGDAAFLADPDLGTCLRETMLAVELPPMTGGSRAFARTSMELLDDEPTDAGP